MTTAIGSGDVVGMEEAIAALDEFERAAYVTIADINNRYLGPNEMGSGAQRRAMMECRQRVHAAAMNVMRTCRFQNQNVRNYVQNRLDNIERMFTV